MPLAPERLWPRRGGTSLRAQLGVDLRTARQGQAGPPLQREYRLRPLGTPLAPGVATLDLQVWEARFLSLAPAGEPAGHVLMVASDVSAQRAAQRAELEAAIAQREMLVQEVHHRIKNNLQGVAGLLQQIGQKRPEVQPIISEVVGQVQAIAQVYGLQVGGVGPLAVQALIEAIAGSLQRNFGRHIVLYLPPPGAAEQGGALQPGSASGGPLSGSPVSGGPLSGSLGDGVISPFDLAPAGGWSLPEAESIPIALTLNELITNAMKHSPIGSDIECRLESGAGGVSISIVNGGRLPEGFRIDHRRSSVSGLGLVKSLLPRRHASLHFMQSGELVIATVTLAPPVVRAIRRPTSAEPDSASALSGAAMGPDPGAA
jgi:two-component sensor histidine kinase